MLTRTSFRFSPAGTRAACLVASEPGAWRVESWSLDPVEPAFTGTELAVRGPASQVLPLDGGAILCCQPAVDDERRHEITLVEPDGSARRIAEHRALGLRLLDHPHAGALAVAVSTDGDAELSSSVWLVRDDATPLTHALTVPGLLAGGSWLDHGATRLAFTRAQRGHLTTLVADLASGSVAPLWPELTGVRLLLASPGGRLRLAADDGHAIGWAAGEGGLRWSATLDGRRAALPLAIDVSGTRVAVRVEDGARSGIAVFTPHDDALADLSLPAGTVGGTASWRADTVRFPFAPPGHPAGIAEVRVGDARTFRLPGTSAATDRLAPRVESFTGPDGAVEAIVHGDWRHAPAVVVALHGGPEACWRIDGDPFLASLAADGTAVVAVNPRGSRGYPGAGEAVRDAWGGPDLRDVLAVATALTGRRGRAVRLFGASYGAFLALLALATRPELWERAAVVAPFLSGERLFADAGPRVRALLDRLGGRTVYTDDLGPRDVLRVADRIAAPLLLMHGTDDDVIPVDHSRELHARLRDSGADVTYLELTGSGHDPLAGPGAGAVAERLHGFLTEGVPSAPAVDHHHGPRGGPHLALGRR